MKFNDRDKVIITFIARHKLVTAKQVPQYMEMGIRATYRRLKKLVDAKHLKHSRIFLQKPGVYNITRKGQDAAGIKIGPTKNIVLVTYSHDLQVVDLSLEFYGKGMK